MIEARYTVRGMVCRHCAQSLADEVERVPGVAAVQVAIEADRLTVTSDRAIDEAELRRAVEAAGYELGPAQL